MRSPMYTHTPACDEVLSVSPGTGCCQMDQATVLTLSPWAVSWFPSSVGADDVGQRRSVELVNVFGAVWGDVFIHYSLSLSQQEDDIILRYATSEPLTHLLATLQCQNQVKSRHYWFMILRKIIFHMICICITSFYLCLFLSISFSLSPPSPSHRYTY